MRHVALKMAPQLCDNTDSETQFLVLLSVGIKLVDRKKALPHRIYDHRLEES
jgi:hypothetical protein